MKKYIKNLVDKEIESISKDLFLESFRGFRLVYFKSITNIPKMVLYAKKYLPFLGQGMGRIVFGYKAGSVIKIAVDSEYGIEQNKNEINFYTSNTKIKDLLVKIFDFDKENYRWIMAEAVKIIEDNAELKNKVSVGERFFDIFIDNVYSTETFALALHTAIEKYNRYEEIEKIENIKINKFTKKLLQSVYLATKNGIDDLFGLSQWGVTMDGRIVVADYGL